MEGLSSITYKNKTIIYGDYTNVGKSKEKTKELIKAITQTYMILLIY